MKPPEPDTSTDTSKLLEYLIGFCCNKAYHAMNLEHLVPRLCVFTLRLSLDQHSAAAEQLYLKTLENYYGNTGGGFVNYELFVGGVSVAWNGALKLAKGM